MRIEDEPQSPTSPPACRLGVKVVPGSRRNQIVGPLGDRLKVKVAAPPEDGRANKAVCELLAGALGVAARSISIVAGHAHPEKSIRIEGLSAAEVSARLGR